MKKTIVVTGACGLIGSHLVDSILINSDYRIVAIDDLSTGKRDHLRSDKRIDFFKVDISFSYLASSNKQKSLVDVSLIT